MKIRRFEKIICLLLIVLGLGLVSLNFLVKTKIKILEAKQPELVPVADIPILSQKANLVDFANQLTAQGIYVMDVNSGTPLLTKNEHERLYPASTVKLLTALTALKFYGDRHTFIIENDDLANGNKNNFQVGEELSLLNLLKALLISSDNDAAFILAKHHPEGEAGFVREMNKTAQELNLSESFFKNPIGFDDNEQLSSAKDLAILARELMKNHELKDLVGIKETIITNTGGELEHQIYTTNEFLAQEFGIVGVKTGTTPMAEQVLITQVEKANRAILIVVMKSKDRFNDSKQIIDYIFSNYTWEKFSN